MKVDVHIISKEPEDYTDLECKWFTQCLKSLEGEPVNLHHVEWKEVEDISLLRAEGFSYGSSEYVSFVDPDDWIEPGAFQKCVDYLGANPSIGGCSTHSNLIHVNPAGDSFKMGLLCGTTELPIKTVNWMVDIHQLAVMRRSVVLQTIEKIKSTMSQYRFEYLYWSIYRDYGWKILPTVGYNWRRRKDSLSTTRADASGRTVDFIKEVNGIK